MLPIDPAELSAFLDGELPAGRAEEVRDALVRDPVLRQSFDQLVACDAAWKAQAESAQFRPRVRFAWRPFSSRYLKVAVIVCGLLLLRLTLKTFPPLYAVGLETILLTLVIGWGLRRMMQTTDADCRRYGVALAS
jgi:hypothetical protein